MTTTQSKTEKLKAYFRSFDSNGDGKITKDELQKFFKQMSGKELDTMWKAVDKNGDGVIDYDEFVDWVMKSSGAAVSSAKDKAAQAATTATNAASGLFSFATSAYNKIASRDSAGQVVITDSTATEVVNGYIQILVPFLRRGIGMQVLYWNKNGGLDLGDSYHLVVVRRNAESAKELKPDDIIEMLSIDVQRVAMPVEAEDSILRLDMQLAIKLKFAANSVAFKLEGKNWRSPNIDLTVKDASFKCHVRFLYKAMDSKLRVAFVKEPEVQWDIDLKVFNLGVPLFDSFEDKKLAARVREDLAKFDLSNPLEIPIVPDKLNALHEDSQKIVQLQVKQIDKKTREAAKGKKKPFPPETIPATLTFPDDGGKASDVFTRIINSFLPLIRRGAGTLFLSENSKNDGLELTNGYHIRIVRKGTDSPKGLHPDDVLGLLATTVHAVHIDDVAPQFDVDIELEAKPSSSIEFHFRGSDWVSPAFDLNVSQGKIRAKIRIGFDLVNSNVKIAFHENPDITWHIEIRALATLVGIPIPEAIEDVLLSKALSSYLGKATLAQPIEVPLEPDEIEVLDEATHDLETLSVPQLKRAGARDLS